MERKTIVLKNEYKPRAFIFLSVEEEKEKVNDRKHRATGNEFL